MKITIIQPYFAKDIADAEKSFNDLIKIIDGCDETADVIVLPEYCDVPINTTLKTDFLWCIERYNEKILKKAKETAIRCKSIVFVNCASKHENSLRNTTYAINKFGEIVGKYYKAHLAPSEYDKFDFSYARIMREPYVIEVDGIKFGFITCYDVYFYEDYITLARKRPDIIINCSHQRTDTRQAISVFSKFLAYNTNSYVLRSSISMGETEKIGGCSMVVAPNGDILLNMESVIGARSVDINIAEKYYKPAGFNGKIQSHFEYVDDGRAYLENNYGGRLE